METVAALTNLEANAEGGPDQAAAPQPCVVVALDGKMMQVKLPQQVHAGSPVKVEAEDTISLGEVASCRPEGDEYIANVEILQALRNVNELTRLARALLAER